MKNRMLILAMLMFNLISCRYLIKEKYNMNESPPLTSKKMYLEQLLNKGIFNAEQLLYIDSAHYLSFINKMLQQDNSIVYIGTYINDSEQVKKSSTLLDNSSCAGRLEKELKTIQSKLAFDNSDLVRKPSMNQLGLYSLKNNRPFRWEEHDAICILMAYSYSLGNYYNKLYAKINELQQKKTRSKVFIVCIDPVYRLED